MDAASELLKKQFPEMESLQSTVIIQSPEHCKNTDVPSVQLIHQESRHHWIGSAVIDGELHIFDSIQSKTSGLISETVNVLKNIYGNIVEYITTDVTQQSGVTDCGVFAIAYITAVCHRLHPEDYRIYQKTMRQHLVSCFESGEMLPFPGTK